MADTPRVTVPVEPRPDLSNEQIQSVMLEAVREVRATVTDHAEAAAMDADIARMERGPVDMGSTGWEVMRAVHRRLAMISAAPAPEGGAVQWGWRVRAKPNRASSHRPWHWQADEPTETTAELCEWEPVYVSLATREEAPAEAGFFVRLQDCLDAAGEAHVSVDTGDLRSALSALRAQPPAREDAQPVAWLVGEGDGTIMTRAAAWAEEKRVQGVPVRPLYTHPAPNALQEDLRDRYVAIGLTVERAWKAGEPDHMIAAAARQALAALQAEQKGGA